MNDLFQPGVGMKATPRCFPPTLFVLLMLMGCDPIAGAPKPLSALRQGGWAPVDRPINAVPGRTECPPGRKAIIAPVPLHPVVEVLVSPGDRVKKGQARADVRAKQAALENARIALKESRRHLGAVDKLYEKGAFSEEGNHGAHVAVLREETNERAATAAWESAQAELEHYTVTAVIDGVVSWLDVSPGMVSRPGTTVWGEILDLSEIDVRCELTAEQADQVSVGQAAKVRRHEEQRCAAVGRVVFVAMTVDKATGLVPVVVRLPNRKGRLRCGVPVQVRFHDRQQAGVHE
jgi:RND family efflux transporter MFP subunit